MDTKSIKSYNWKDKTVLIVENDHLSLQFLKELLSYTGIEILDAPDGKDGLFWLKKHSGIDLIIYDIDLQSRESCEMVRKIKSFKDDLPIIAQSTYILIEDREKCYHAGCDAFIGKPVDTFELLWKMDHFLSGEMNAENPGLSDYSEKTIKVKGS